MAYDPYDPNASPPEYNPGDPNDWGNPAYHNTGVFGGGSSPAGPTLAPSIPGYPGPMGGNTGAGDLSPLPPAYLGPMGGKGGNTGITGGFAAQRYPWDDPRNNPQYYYYNYNNPDTSSPSAAQKTPFNYEQARNSWMSGQYGGGEAGARAWAAANGVPYQGGDTINLPNGGGNIDIIGNFQGGQGNPGNMRNNWTPAGGNGPNPAGQGFGGASAGPGGGPGAGGGVGLDAEMRNQLLALMKRGSSPFDVNAPELQAQYLPQRTAIERQAQQAKMAAAERANFEGSGNLEGIQRSIGERAGEQSSQALGGVVGQEVQAKRQDLMGALQLANSIGAREQAAQIQRELAQLESGFRYADLGQRTNQWNDVYGLQRTQMAADENRRAVLAGMG